MTKRQVIAHLRREAKRVGNYTVLAAKMGVSQAMLSRVMDGQRAIGPVMLRGLARVGIRQEARFIYNGPTADAK